MLNLFEKIKAIQVSYNIVSLQRSISVLEKLLASEKVIDIAVLGQFKAGKSSFINSFLNSSILPTGVIPVTSVITRLAYGNEEKVIVRFEDGKLLETGLNSLKEFVEEARNPENKKNVAVVDIFLPQLEKYKGIRIVDTPGMGSYYKHNTTTTLDWSPEIGISILAISAERPLSDNEVELIKELTSYTPKIIIILTKTDLFDNIQLDEISNYISKSLSNEFKRDFRIYYYSTKKNQESYRTKIEDEIIAPILLHLDETYNDIINHKLNAIRLQCVGYLELSHQSALKSENEKAELKKQILDEKTNVDYLIKEVRLICNSYTSQTRESISAILQNYQSTITEELTKHFADISAHWNGNLNKQTKSFESWIIDALRTRLYIIADNNHYKLIDILQKAKKHFSLFLKNFQDRINHNIKNALGIQLHNEEFEIDISNINQPDIMVSRTFDFALDVVWFFFPMFIFRNIFHRHFKKQIPALVETNIYRLVSDYTEKINKEILNLERKTIKLIIDEYKTIESALNTTTTNKEKILEDLESLK